MDSLRPGDPAEIGGYRLRAHLGRGGMGTVYLASTPGGRLVALKSIRAELVEDPEFRERFRLEVRAARRVRGLYTAELLDADPEAVPPWLVTSYVSGPSLARALKAQGPVPPVLVPLLLAGVAEALLDIHSAGIVHRDLKPSNVLLSPDGPRVIDFGIARALDGVKLTLSGVTMGSPECMAPEQVRGLPVTPAADVFALGSLGGYALRGRSPFDAPNAAATMFRIAHQAPDLDGVPEELRVILEACLARHPGDRPSPAEVLDLCRTRIPDEPAVFPWMWRLDADGMRESNGIMLGTGRSSGLDDAEGDRSASGNQPPAPDGTPSPSKNGWGSPTNGWAAGTAVSAAPPAADPTRTEASVPPPWPAAEPLAVPEPGQRPPVATWLMYGAAAVTAAALITGMATLPSLRAMISQHHPGSAPGAVSTAVDIAAVIIAIRALAGIGPWLWAARYAQRHEREKIASLVALVLSTLGIAGSSPRALSTFPVQLLSLAGWLLGLGAVALAWLPRDPARPARNGDWQVFNKSGKRRKPPSRSGRSDSGRRAVVPGWVIGAGIEQRAPSWRSAPELKEEERQVPVHYSAGEEADGAG
jgi:serine/threonine protein kinase